MRIVLNDREKELLEKAKIDYSAMSDYSEMEALDLLDEVHDVEAKYANFPKDDREAQKLFDEYATLADKIQDQIPNF